MDLNILVLNCQKNYNKNLRPFLKKTLRKGKYDLFLLQEATNDVLEPFKSFKKYSILNSKDKLGRLSLPCIVYNSKKFTLKNLFYEPIFLDGFERQELKKPFQSFGILRAVLDFQGIKIVAGSIHLPSGLSIKKRFRALKSAKIIMDEVKNPEITFYGGDLNFCSSYEIRKASKILGPEYKCITSQLGPTLDSYFTESHLHYSHIRINNVLRNFGIRIKLKTDHIFVDQETLKRNKVKAKILRNRVSDHSPIEMALKI